MIQCKADLVRGIVISIIRKKKKGTFSLEYTKYTYGWIGFTQFCIIFLTYLATFMFYWDNLFVFSHPEIMVSTNIIHFEIGMISCHSLKSSSDVLTLFSSDLV